MKNKKEDKRFCVFCNKIIIKSKDEWYSIVMYDKEYKVEKGEVFCSKCAKFVYRIMVAHYEKALHPIKDLMTDRLKRLKQLKSNVKKIKWIK